MGYRHTQAFLLSSIALLLSTECVPSKATKGSEKARSTRASIAPSSGARPSWIDLGAFASDSSGGSEEARAYAVAACPIDADADVCWKPALLIQACRNRALSELGKALGRPTQEATAEALSTTSTATLRKAEVKVGWYDGDRTLYAVAEQPEPGAAMLERLPRASFSGGVPLLRLESDLRVGARAFLEASGVCKDARRRPFAACCGAPETFCSDPTRFAGAVAGGKCRCGESPPCMHDFKCEVRKVGYRCICEGPKCPCDVFSCRKGQTCGDGRCY